MTSRERLRRALRHETGPVPIDFGSTAVTGMHVSCVAALRQRLGLGDAPVKVHEPYQMLGLIEPDLQDALGIDVIGFGGSNTIFGFPNRDWREWRAPWGQVVLVSSDFTTSERDDGVYLHPCGDRTAPPSGYMPKSSVFFDTIVRQEPIDDNALDPADNLQEFGPISASELRHFKGEYARCAATEKGIAATFGGTALGDIALVPAPFLRRPRGIRDITEWYISTLTRQDYIHAVFERQVAIAIENLKTVRTVVGDEVSVVFMCGTDFGSQESLFCSPDTFDALYGPYYRRLNDWVHTHTDWLTFKHSCGAVEPLITRFIDVGFDVLNPVQCSARGMAPEHLKAHYGDRLVFWGGGVDTQKTLPFGTPEDVRREVTQRCRTLSRSGGFVFDAIHNVQAHTPVANILAMIDAVHDFNQAGR